jgi:hypothetical protein
MKKLNFNFIIFIYKKNKINFYMIKDFKDFTNEGFFNSNNDISKIINALVINNISTDEIMEFKNDLNKLLLINESIKDDLNRLKYKYGNWLN